MQEAGGWAQEIRRKGGTKQAVCGGGRVGGAKEGQNRDVDGRNRQCSTLIGGGNPGDYPNSTSSGFHCSTSFQRVSNRRIVSGRISM
jgi:hypothetical protein